MYARSLSCSIFSQLEAPMFYLCAFVGYLKRILLSVLKHTYGRGLHKSGGDCDK